MKGYSEDFAQLRLQFSYGHNLRNYTSSSKKRFKITTKLRWINLFYQIIYYSDTMRDFADKKIPLPKCLKRSREVYNSKLNFVNGARNSARYQIVSVTKDQFLAFNFQEVNISFAKIYGSRAVKFQFPSFLQMTPRVRI